MAGAEDIDAIAHWMSDAEVARWLSSVPWPYTRGDARWFVEEFAAQSDDPHWAIDAGAGLIGVISVKPDLGYWLARPFHGRGYMSEAVSAVLQWTFDNGAEEVVSGHFPGNANSRSVLLKAGFGDSHRETVIRQADEAPQQLQRMVLPRAAWALRQPTV